MKWQCVLEHEHGGDHLVAEDDRPKLRKPGARRCEYQANAPPPIENGAFAHAPIDVDRDRERREAESSADGVQVCPHCGFAPVSHEEWKRTVLEHYGANAGAVIVEMTQRAFDLGRMAGKLEAEATRFVVARSERAKIAERLRAMHAARVRSSTPLHVDLDVLADDIENERPLAFVE